MKRADRAPLDAAAIEERAGLAADRVPLVYLDSWARLNCQKPATVSEAEWRLALDDGGRFLDAWGAVAEGWGWTVSELFDAPHEGSLGGLVWFCGGELVKAFGPDHCRTEAGRAFNRRPMKGSRHG